MKKYLLITTIGLSVIYAVVYGQSTKILNSPIQLTNADQTETARDEIRLTHGFSIQPGNKTFTARIDETIVGNAEYVPEITSTSDPNHPHNRQLDKNLAVGRLEGAIDVSSFGGAVYNIPIPLPEGINGMTPQLGIAYNSHGGNGILGIGWGLSGISTITRTGQTIYHDGAASVMKVSNDLVYDGGNDRLMLDGQRLIAFTPELGLETVEYRTETESYASIKKIGLYGSRYFEVTTKDGKKIEYRNDNSVYFNPIAWWISKVTDPDGNYIRYIYKKDNSSASAQEQYIQRIEYGNDGNSVTASVVFGYDERYDNRGRRIDMSGRLLKSTVLLKYIAIYDGDTRIGKYTFNYTYNYNYIYGQGLSRLVEIVPENGQGEKLNSTLFTWTRTTTNLSGNTTPVSCSFNAKNIYVTGDFNGDGITDILEIDPEYYKIASDRIGNELHNLFNVCE